MIPETVSNETREEATAFYNSLNRMLRRQLKKSINSGADLARFMPEKMKKDRQKFDDFVSALKVLVNK